MQVVFSMVPPQALRLIFRVITVVFINKSVSTEALLSQLYTTNHFQLDFRHDFPLISIYSKLVQQYFCTDFIFQYKNQPDEVEPIAVISHRSYHDTYIYNSESLALANISRELTDKRRFNHCVLTWAELDSEELMQSLIRWFQNGRRRSGNTKFPRLDSDYFVFHIVNLDTNFEHSVADTSTFTQSIKFGIVIKTGKKISTALPMETIQFVDFTRNLNGKRVKVTLPTALDFRVAVTKNADSTYGVKEGAYGSFAQILATKMNFTPIFSPASANGATGLKLKNGSWIGATGDLIHRRADISVALIITASRFPFIDYSFPLERLTMTFSTARPRKYFSWLAVMAPLPNKAYILILLAMVAVALTFAIESHFRKHYLKVIAPKPYQNLHQALRKAFKTEEVRRISHEFTASIMFLVASLLAQSYVIRRHGRLLTAVWLLAVIILSTAYQSNLFYFMTFPLHDPVLETFDELANSDYDLTLWSGGGSSYSYFLKGTSPAHRKIFSRISTEGNIVKCLAKSLKSSSSCIIYTEMADFTIQTEMSNRFGQTPFRIATARTFPFFLAVAMQKHSILRDSINKIVMPTVESRIFERFVIQHINEVKARKRTLKTGSDDMNLLFPGYDCELRPFLGNFVGVFYFLLGGLFLAILVGLAECLPRMHIMNLICRKILSSASDHLIIL